MYSVEVQLTSYLENLLAAMKITITIQIAYLHFLLFVAPNPLLGTD